jgi:hypothetical protein
VTHAGYLVAGYALTAVALLAYVARLRWRGRALARVVGAGREGAGAGTAEPAHDQ